MNYYVDFVSLNEDEGANYLKINEDQNELLNFLIEHEYITDKVKIFVHDNDTHYQELKENK